MTTLVSPSQPRPARRRWQAPVAVTLALLLVGGCTADRSSPAGDDAATAPADESVSSPVTEEVVVAADGLDLLGTLTLPATGGPHPTVVIVHGSGPVDRDGTARGQLGLQLGSAVPVYAELASALVDAGYGVFRWDKRTCGPFNGCGDNDYPRPTDGRSQATA